MKKKILGILTVLLMIVMLFSLTACGDDDEGSSRESSSSGAEEVVEDFMNYMIKGQYSKIAKLIDYPGMYLVTDEYMDYEDIDEDYDYYCDYYEDEIEEFKDDFKDELEEMEEEYDEDYMEGIRLKKVGNKQKVDGTSNIYKVKVTLENEDEDDTRSTYIYLIKKDGDYYIIYGDF